MFSFFDKPIEKLFKRGLYKQRQYYIRKAINKFIKQNHPDERTIAALKAKLEEEADRVYAIVDKSVLRAGIKRAKWTFLLTAIASTIIIGVLGFFSSGAILPFIIPVLAAFITWAVSLATIPFAYNERIKGGLDSVVLTFKKSLNADSDAEPEFDLKKSKKEIETIKRTLIKIIDKVNAMHNRVGDNAALNPEEQMASFSQLIAEDPELNATWAALQTKLATEESQQSTNTTHADLTAEIKQNKNEIDEIKMALHEMSSKIEDMSNKVDALSKIKSPENFYSASTESRNESTAKNKHFKFHFWHKDKTDKKENDDKNHKSYIYGS